MPKINSASSDKVKAAVKVLIRAPALSVPEAMRVAKFSDEEAADPALCRLVQRSLPGGSRKVFRSIMVGSLVRVNASVTGQNVHEPTFLTPGPDDVIPPPNLNKTRLSSNTKQKHCKNECRLSVQQVCTPQRRRKIMDCCL